MNTQNYTINESMYVDLFNFNLDNDIDNIHEEYSMYVMDNADPAEVTICNGATLLQATEDEYLLAEFMSHWIVKTISDIKAFDVK